MTVSSAERRNEYTGNGSQTVFPYTFRIFSADDLKIYVAGVLQTITTHYTVSGVDVPTGGNVTFIAAPASSTSVVILSDTVEDQQTDYIAQGPFPAETHERALDKLTVFVQEHEEILRRTLTFSVFSLLKDKTIDDFTADKFARVKADLSGIQWVDVVPAGSIGVPVSVAQGGTGSTTPATARDTLMADEDARTATVKVVNTQKSTTTGTPAAGIGTGEKFQAESADESPSDFGQIEFEATDVGAGSEDTIFNILLRIAGAALARIYSWRATTAFRAIFTHANSADRTYTLPNTTGTVALTSDLSSVTGLEISNNGVDAINDIDIAVGAAVSGDAAIVNRVLMSLTSGLTKQLDAAWAVGNNAGMRDTGAIADGTWHIFLIKRTDTGVVDVLASQSFGSPTMPTNYDKKKWIFAIVRSAGTIRTFLQRHDSCFWKVPTLDVGAVTLDATHEDRTVTVPSGLKVEWIGNIRIQTINSGTLCIITDPDLGITSAASTTAAPLASLYHTGNANVNGDGGAQLSCLTNTGAQIRTNGEAGGATFHLVTLGWRVNRAEVR